MFAKPRVVVKKVLSKEQPEGDGATVRRSIGRWVSVLDVMLNLNEFWNDVVYVSPIFLRDSGSFGSWKMILSIIIGFRVFWGQDRLLISHIMSI